LTLSGDAANGVIWSTSVGVVSKDAPEYAGRWKARFNQDPKSSYAYNVRDAFEIWVQAVEKAGCVDCYEKVNANIKATEYQGMSGFYKFNQTDQQALFGEKFIPTLWYQVQNGAHVIVGPNSFKAGDYTLPPWIK
jgi:ABC-type branched-subunit amino acid transport system substrate-binding protein